jgi:hypothetical protein
VATLHDWKPAHPHKSRNSHKLAGDAAGFFVHAKGTNVPLYLAFCVDAHGRQVVEHHSQITIHERPDLLGQFSFYAINIVHQRIHSSQEGDVPVNVEL